MFSTSSLATDAMGARSGSLSSSICPLLRGVAIERVVFKPIREGRAQSRGGFHRTAGILTARPDSSGTTN